MDRSVPNIDLSLSWIYGYRGHQCRNNVVLNISGELVYFIAGVAIVYNTTTQKQRYYLEHTDDLLCLKSNLNGSMIATGQTGKDPFVCVWDATTLKTKSILKGGHQNGICSLAFDPSGEKLASCGMDSYSTIVVWLWKTGTNVCSFRGHSDRGPLYSIYSNDQDSYQSFASGGKDATIKLWDLNFELVSTISTKLPSLLSNKSGVKEFVNIRAIYWKGDRIVCGTQNSEIFEVSSTETSNFTIHIQGHLEGELWGLALNEMKNLIVTGSDDQTIRIWDMGKRRQISIIKLTNKIRSVDFNHDGTIIGAGLINGELNIIDIKTNKTLQSFKLRKEALHDIKFSPKSDYLAVGSNDNFVDIFGIKNGYTKIGTCEGSSSFITHVDWSIDAKYIRTNSAASEILFYKIPACKQLTRTDEINKIAWKSNTGVLGSDLLGIWPKYSDANDINALDVFESLNCLFTADDFGHVKVFRYPCSSKHKKYKGHSAHVTNIRISRGRKVVYSIGGADHALFEWSIADKKKGNIPNDAQSYETDGYTDSDDSNVGGLDSDVENDNTKNYDRAVYREDLENSQSQQTSINCSSGNCTLKLKQVLGILKFLKIFFRYRGYDCRNNVLFSKNSDTLIYHIAAVVIIQKKFSNDSDHITQFYNLHNDDILSIAIHPIKDFVASGQVAKFFIIFNEINFFGGFCVGRDPSIHIWDVKNLKNISILKGKHQRGVIFLDFSSKFDIYADGKLLASVGLDDDHTIVVWDWRKGECVASTKGHKDKIYALKWFDNESEHNFVSGGVKHLKFWKITGNSMTASRGTLNNVGKLDTTLSICINQTKKNSTYTSGSSGCVYEWETNKLLRSIEANKGPCFSIINHESSYITAGKDGVVVVWNEDLTSKVKEFSICQKQLKDSNIKINGGDNPGIRALCATEKTIIAGSKFGEILEIQKNGQIDIINSGHGEGEIWGLATHPSQHEFCTVSDDKYLRIWRINQVGQFCKISSMKLKSAARCCSYSSSATAIVIGFKNGSFEVYEYPSLKKIIEKKDRKEEISDVRFSPDAGKYLAVASHDNFVDVYNVFTQKRVGICKGASSYITHIDWENNGKLIMVNSGAKEQLFFEAPRCKRQALRAKDIENRSWNSWTCVLGTNITGIWPKRCDVTDINAAAVSNSNTFIATADDFGYVKVFPFPCQEKNTNNFKQYEAHSAHVTNLRWTFDDKYLISVGGADTSVILWENVDSKKIESKQIKSDSAVNIEPDEYDSDVDKLINVNFSKKTYENPQRSLKDKLTTDHREHKPPAKSFSREKKTTDIVLNKLKQKSIKIQSLNLYHIFGYRGTEIIGTNAFYSHDQQSIIFFTAATVIIQEIKSGKQKFFTEHTDDILCLTLNFNQNYSDIVASGQIGKKAEICIWNKDTLKLESILTGPHSTALTCLSFSCTGKVLVSSSVDGIVAVWRWKESKLVCHKKIENQRVFGVQIRPDSDSSLVIYGDRLIYFASIAGNQLQLTQPNFENFTDMKKIPIILSIAFSNNKTSYMGASNGNVYAFKDTVLENVYKAHNGPIFSMFTTLKDGLIISGAKQRNTGDSTCLKIWDRDFKKSKNFNVSEKPNEIVRVKSVNRHANGKILVGTQDNSLYEIDERSNMTKCIVSGHGAGEMWGLCVHPSKDLIFTGSDDKTVRIWDITKKALIKKLYFENCVRCVHYSKTFNLACGLSDGNVIVMNGNEDYAIKFNKRERNAAVNDIKFTPNGAYFSVAFDNGFLDIYESKSIIKKYWSFNLDNVSLIQLDYSADSKYIKICNIACIDIVINIEEKKHIKELDSVWYSWNSLTGKCVNGIWPSEKRNSDINIACVSNSTNNVITGDDFGFLKLFNFPCEKYEPSQIKSYTGHSAHVTNVKFNHDDHYVLSAGGDDSRFIFMTLILIMFSLFVWTCQK
ncbi:hypothetical protein A3Q56_02173 [Intoshia linei]|uniref:Echinoderm microtubule-associated protein-like 6 n=1 Tax=Intoshia linei TaxID=1819745 RepID=A0A177B9F6_9BILA|nr:hypothetical protein A3Q56_02173 [Intoshia linei]